MSGNVQNGIRLGDDGHQVWGNRVGTDANGWVMIPNGTDPGVSYAAIREAGDAILIGDPSGAPLDEDLLPLLGYANQVSGNASSGSWWETGAARRWWGTWWALTRGAGWGA